MLYQAACRKSLAQKRLAIRRGDRAAEGAALEMLCGGNSTMGSNPILSASVEPRFVTIDPSMVCESRFSFCHPVVPFLSRFLANLSVAVASTAETLYVVRTVDAVGTADIVGSANVARM